MAKHERLGNGTGKKGRRTQGKLTRGGAHAGRSELPQDEALLTLSQCEEELIGFYALLTETKHRAPSTLAGTGSQPFPGWEQLTIWLSLTIHIKEESTQEYALEKACGLLCMLVFKKKNAGF